MPEYGSDLASGFDLFACLEGLQRNSYFEGIPWENYNSFTLENRVHNGDFYTKDYVCILPGKTRVIPVGFRIELPEGYGMFVLPRSGISLRTGLRVSNSPGLIDADYRGVVGVLCWNSSDSPLVIRHGDKIAQAVIMETPKINLLAQDSLSETNRGEGGFGSTGV